MTWETPRFGELYAENSRNGIYKSSEYQGRGTPIVNMGEMFGFEFISDQEMKRVELTKQELDINSLENGDLLFGRRSVVPSGAGKCSIVFHTPEPTTFESSIIRVRLDQKRAIPLFYYYLYTSPVGRSFMSEIISGTNVKGIRATELKQLFTFEPPRAEQKAISEALSDVDGLIAGLEALIAKKRALKTATMQQLLTGKTRLPGFDGEWNAHLVSDVILRNFCGPSPTCEERNIDGSAEWGVLKTTAITWEKGWDWRKHKVLPRAFWGKKEIELRKGDVLVTKAGPRHRVGVATWVDYVPRQVLPSGKMIVLRPNEEIAIAPMLAAALSAAPAQSYLDQRTTGMAESQENFENEDLLNTPVVLPEMDEQLALAEVISDFDAEISALEAQLMKSKTLKQGMMQELLTGRTRLV